MSPCDMVLLERQSRLNDVSILVLVDVALRHILHHVRFRALYVSILDLVDDALRL